MYVVISRGYESDEIEDAFGPFSTEEEAERYLNDQRGHRIYWGGFVMLLTDPDASTTLDVPIVPSVDNETPEPF